MSASAIPWDKASPALALFGKAPAFPECLHVGRPNIGNRDYLLARMRELLDRRWLTNGGPLVREFERKIADYIGVKHCIAMCNATVALEIAARAAGLRGEVIVPSYTFIATAHSLKWQRITPVFCDIDPRTHNLDPRQIERLITPQTTGIIGVHLWGRPCPIDELSAVARAHHLTLMFDAAHAFGCSYQGRMIGTFGLCEVLSFHATKLLNSFEGGAVVTNNEELAARIRLMKNFGFAGYDDVVCLGTNGKMSEASAAMGLANLESVTEFLGANRRNYAAYQAGLRNAEGLRLIQYDAGERCNYQYIVVEVDEQRAGLSRDELVTVLQVENVLARKYFWPGCHGMEPYRSCSPQARLRLPETERLAARVMVLPTGTAVGPAEIRTVCRIIRTAVTHGRAVRKAIVETGKWHAHSNQETPSLTRVLRPVPRVPGLAPLPNSP